jgi:phosphoribosylamine--glycine ligase
MMSKTTRDVLIVGQGGREHALAWALARQGKVGRILAAPGNAGIAEIAECFPVSATDLDGQVELAEQQKPDLVLVAPDDPLALGLVDRLNAVGIRAFGPTAAAARIECDKVFAKRLMWDAGVPTAEFRSFTNAGEACDYIARVPHRVVVKASGLAAGKGAIVTSNKEEALAAIDEIMVKRAFGAAGEAVVIEEFMEGEEASLFAICDGKHYRTFVTAQDHKAVFDGDRGPNTGGMGAYAPAPVVNAELEAEVGATIIQPTLKALAAAGCPYHGILYVGLMITASGPKVVEMNARWGDPETQVVVPLLNTDMLALMDASIDGTLGEVDIDCADGAAVVVMLASGGYPGSYVKGFPIIGVDRAAACEGVLVFHSGTARKDGDLVTNGGRVLGVTAVAGDIPAAVARAYEAANHIHFEGMHFRRDIAHRALKRL